MPLYNIALDDDVVTDISMPVDGVNNSMAPTAIGANQYVQAENRLTQRDGLNRPRPGIVRLNQIGVNVDSINHLGQGIYLVNNAASWYEYAYSTNTLTPKTVSPPAFSLGDQVFATLANNVLYFSRGMNRPADTSALLKYSTAGGFGTVTLNSNGPYAAFPLWACYRLMYAYQNTIIVSDLLAPESFDVATGSVTLDPQTSDYISGLALWQEQVIVAFRYGSTYLVTTGPNLSVPDWSINRISATVGCRCHGATVQTENDVYFLSESGRGVYAVSQSPASNQQGIWIPLSLPIQPYIDRINWAACDNARATYWNDLYILSVPLDGVAYNNFMLVYSVSTNAWQGLWCIEQGTLDIGARDFARDRTNTSGTVLMAATKDGILSKMSYPLERKYFDQNIDGSHSLYNSELLSRSFALAGDSDVNQIRPNAVRLRFLQSADPVNVTVWGDRTLQLHKVNYPTTTSLLSLPIAGFPFDLDVEGYKNVPISLMHCGICTEMQVELTGNGNWTIFEIKTSLFPSMPMVTR